VVIRLLCAFLFFSAAVPVCAEMPVASDLHTVSVHVDSAETFNALLRFFDKDLQWPVIYGKPWTADRGARRSYAGIWAGNVVLEICGPYDGETFTGGVRARLHGLTFRPFHTAGESIVALDRAGILHKPQFDSAGGNLRFVILDDPDLTSPTLSVSIMEVRDRNREKLEQDTARAAQVAKAGGPLGLKSVHEIHIGYHAQASLAKWRRFLTRGRADTDDSPSLRLVEGPQAALIALVIRVASAAQANAFLKSMGSETVLTPGVKILCIE
jgi:hypothetical protein